MSVVTRTARETVMLEALESIERNFEWHDFDACTARYDLHKAQCPTGIAARAIATVKAMDEAELAAGPVTT